jgi:hypothetical protein
VLEALKQAFGAEAELPFATDDEMVVEHKAKRLGQGASSPTITTQALRRDQEM